MNRIALFCFFTLLLICSIQADLTLTQKVEGAGGVKETTIKIKGDKARIEAGPEVASIIDGKTGEMLNLMMSEKKIVRISAAQAKAAAEMAMQADSKNASAARPQLKPTGKKETINGYEAEEYTREAPAFKATYWISTKYPDSASIVKQLQAMTPQAWNLSGGMPDYRDFPGLPLRTRISFGGNEITTTLTSVKLEALADSVFVPPSGFEEIKIPDLDSMLNPKPAAKPAAVPKS